MITFYGWFQYQANAAHQFIECKGEICRKTPHQPKMYLLLNLFVPGGQLV